jgi:hypothetical protein
LGAVAKNLLAKTPQEIAIPSIVLFEVEVGIAKSTSPQKRKQQLKGPVPEAGGRSPPGYLRGPASLDLFSGALFFH